MAMARHAGVDHAPLDPTDHGYDLPLLANGQPAGTYRGVRCHRAGGGPAVLWELLQAGRLDGDCLTRTGRTIAENIQGCESRDREVIRPFGDPLMEKAGYLALSGNLFDLGILKSSVISDEFRARYLARPGHEGEIGRAHV